MCTLGPTWSLFSRALSLCRFAMEYFPWIRWPVFTVAAWIRSTWPHRPTWWACEWWQMVILYSLDLPPPSALCNVSTTASNLMNVETPFSLKARVWVFPSIAKHHLLIRHGRYRTLWLAQLYFWVDYWPPQPLTDWWRNMTPVDPPYLHDEEQPLDCQNDSMLIQPDSRYLHALGHSSSHLTGLANGW